MALLHLLLGGRLPRYSMEKVARGQAGRIVMVLRRRPPVASFLEGSQGSAPAEALARRGRRSGSGDLIWAV